MINWRLTFFFLFTGALSQAAPVKVIFDTDITGDVDDVLALAMLHTLEDRGACELLAVTISKEHELAAPFVDAVNTFYGRPDLPIGINPDAPHRDSKYLELVEEKDRGEFRYPHDIGVSSEPENAVNLLRRILAGSEDHSVVIMQVGLATNLAALLETGSDNLSRLNGKELVQRKVALLSVMAGAFESIGNSNHYLEANVKNHIPSMQYLAAHWPDEVPVIWSGFKIGIEVRFPRESIAEDFNYVDHHIVREAYLLHSGPDHDRPSWDLTSVLYAAYPDRGYFDLSVPGRVTVEDDGFTRFDPAQGTRFLSPANLKNMPASKKRDRYLLMNPEQAARVKEALIHLVVQPPMR
ncbi:MAG: nucleoside hydrolase [Verrucomicrobiae bacterium]|nr:nucleoside hydrolase [Verrucomicrobiae bacterium]